MSEKITLLPEYLSIVQDTSLDFYNKSTNILNAIKSFLAETNENIKFTKSLVTVNQLSAYGILFDELNKTNFTIENFTLDSQNNIVPDGTKMLSNDFKLFFIEKYQSLSAQYKLRVDNLIKNNVYFVKFSDDIGYITDTNSILDNNTVPFFDVYNQQTSVPTYLAASIDNKASYNEILNAKLLSYYTDILFKVNLQGLQTGNLSQETAKTAHGTNLINDILYYNRAVTNNQSILNELQVVLGEISSFIMFFKNLNPQDNDPERKAIFYKYSITNMEGLKVEVDVLKNNLAQLQLSSKQVLGVEINP